MNWFVYSLLAMSLFVVYNLQSRVLSVKTRDPVVFAGVFNVIAGFTALSFFLFEDICIFENVLDWKDILFAIIGMGFWLAFVKLEYPAKKITEASIFSIVIKFAPIVTVIFSILFLGEAITWFKAFAVVLTILANIIVMFDKGLKLKVDSVFMMSLACAVALGLAWGMDKVVSVNFNTAFYTFWVFIVPGIIVLLSPKIKWRDIVLEFKNVGLHKITFLALSNTLGYFFLIKAFSVGEISKVILITSFSGIITSIFAIIFLKEREKLAQKIIGAMLVLIATLLLG